MEIMYDVSISARLTTTTTKEGWWSIGDHVRCIHLSIHLYNYDEGGMVQYWRSYPLSTVNNYDEGGMVEYWRSCTMYLSTVNYNYDEGGMVHHVRCIHSARLTTTTTKEGWWSVGDHVRCIHLSTVNYNYDEGGMVECWRSCTMYPSQHG